MSRYSTAVAWIALNDNDGGDDRLNVESIASYLTTCLVADLFSRGTFEVADAVVRFRIKQDEIEKRAARKKSVGHVTVDFV